MYVSAVDLTIRYLRKRALYRITHTEGNFHKTGTYVWALRFDAQVTRKAQLRKTVEWESSLEGVASSRPNNKKTKKIYKKWKQTNTR